MPEAEKQILENEEYLEPETIRDLLGTDDSLEVQKELVKKLITNTHAPFVDFYVFENVAQVLNGVEPNVKNVEGVSPEFIWYALKRIKELGPALQELSHEVKMYIRFMHKNRGLVFLPEGWGFKNPNIEEVKKRAQSAEGDNILTEGDPLDIQAIKYLRIQEYLNSK